MVFVGVLFIGCQDKSVKKPVFLNPKPITVVNQDSLVFEVGTEEWKARVNTPVQLIYPEISFNKNQLTVKINSKNGVIEGPSFLTLQSGEFQFIYPISINNIQTTSQLADLRSPKTVNTDSSMIQQQILYSFDSFGNLSTLENEEFFIENNLELAPKTGIFKAQANSSVSSFYIDPGTVTSIPLDIIGGSQNKVVIQAGPLIDQFNNPVSNGTLIQFFIQKDGFQKNFETVVQDSYGRISLTYSEIEKATIVAKIAQVYSKKLTFQKP